MDVLSFVTLICIQIASPAGVAIEKCEKHYLTCIERLANMPGAAEKGIDQIKIAQILYNDPLSRNKLCK